MIPANITNLGLLQEDSRGNVSRLNRAFQGIPWAGTNVYLPVDASHVAACSKSQHALSPSSIMIVTNMIADMASMGVKSYYLNVGLEPTDPTGYAFANGPAGQSLLTQLGKDLADYQQQADEDGASLVVTVRYASEMNISAKYSPSQKPDPNAYKTSFPAVQNTIKAANPTIRMAFSPAINFQQSDAGLDAYWPAGNEPDVISCTFYINGATKGTDPNLAVKNMQDYFLHRLGRGLPFGIDEMGGWDPAKNSNDDYLQLMFAGIAQLAGKVSLDYVTVFLQNSTEAGGGQYDANPTLGFLTAPAVEHDAA